MRSAVSRRAGPPSVWLALVLVTGCSDTTSTPAPPASLEVRTLTGGNMRAVETDGYIDLYLIGVDGSSLRRLTHDPERSASGPAWSPDGSRIAFTSFSRDEGIASIFVMDVDGSNLVRLTDRGAYDQTPSWSRDGSRIAFTGRREGRWDVFVMAADGSSIVNLTKNYHSDWIGPQAWGR